MTVNSESAYNRYSRLVRRKRPVDDDVSITRRDNGSYDVEIDRHFDLDSDGETDITFSLVGNSTDRFFRTHFSGESTAQSEPPVGKTKYFTRNGELVGGRLPSPLATRILSRTLISWDDRRQFETHVGSLRVQKAYVPEAGVTPSLTAHERSLVQLVEQQMRRPALQRGNQGEVFVSFMPNVQTGQFIISVRTSIDLRDWGACQALEQMKAELEAATKYEVSSGMTSYRNELFWTDVKAINAEIRADPRFEKLVNGDLDIDLNLGVATVTGELQTNFVGADEAYKTLVGFLSERLGENVKLQMATSVLERCGAAS